MGVMNFKLKLVPVVACLVAVVGCNTMYLYTYEDARVAKKAEIEAEYMKAVSATSLRTEEAVRELEIRRIKIETYEDRIQAIKLLMRYNFGPAIASGAVDLYIMKQQSKGLSKRRE